MSDVAQADRESADRFFSGHILGNEGTRRLESIFAAHRIAAEKAVLDRLRGWTDDDHEYLGTGITQTQATALADALETKR